VTGAIPGSDVDRWLVDHADELADLTSELVRVPTVTGQEGLLAPVIAQWLDRHGLEPEVRPVDAGLRDRWPTLAGEDRLEQRPNVYGWLRSPRGRLGPPVVLNGHMDVVPPGHRSRWSRDPFGGDRADGIVWGRGAADMKGPIATAMMVLRGFRENSTELNFDVQLQCVIAEESSSLGTLSALVTEPRPAAVIVLEPSEGAVVSAAGGSLQFAVEVTGRAAHSSAPWRGASALDGLIACYEALGRLAQRRNKAASHALFAHLPLPAPFAVGTFHAGEWRAMLPETATLSGRLGVMPGEAMEHVRSLVVDELHEVARRDDRIAEPPEVRWLNEGFPAWETPTDAPVVDALQAARHALTGESGTVAVTFGSDAGHFAMAGIPVAVFGPGDIGTAHMADEYVCEAHLVRDARVLASALIRMSDAMSPPAAAGVPSRPQRPGR
jgi:acetylornithine deacetylase